MPSQFLTLAFFFKGKKVKSQYNTVHNLGAFIFKIALTLLIGQNNAFLCNIS